MVSREMLDLYFAWVDSQIQSPCRVTLIGRSTLIASGVIERDVSLLLVAEDRDLTTNWGSLIAPNRQMYAGLRFWRRNGGLLPHGWRSRVFQLRPFRHLDVWSMDVLDAVLSGLAGVEDVTSLDATNAFDTLGHGPIEQALKERAGCWPLKQAMREDVRHRWGVLTGEKELPLPHLKPPG